MVNKPSDYVDIACWGRFLGSFRHYIENQQELAAGENAPLDAIFRGLEPHGKWHRASELDAHHEYHAYKAKWLKGEVGGNG